MKKSILSAFLLLLTISAAQTQNIDSLQQALIAMPRDTHRVLAYMALCRAFYSADQMDGMLTAAEQGIELSRTLHYDHGLDICLFFKGTALDIMGKSRDAIPAFEEGLQLVTRLGHSESAADYHVNIGTAYYSLGDIDLALPQFLMAYDIFKAQNQAGKLSKVLNNIGIIYRRQGKSDRAEEIYKMSLEIKKELKDTLGIAASYKNLASVLSSGAREKETIDYLNKALQIYEQMGRKSDAAGCYALLGQIHVNFGRFAAAKQALLKAITVFEQNPSVEFSATTYRLLGTVAVGEQDYNTAEKNYLEAMKWARLYNRREDLWDILNELSKVQERLGKPAAAYQTLREAYILRDSNVTTNRLALMEEMQTKFDVVQKDNIIKINALELQKRTQQRNMLLFGVLGFAVLAAVIFFGLRARIRANKKIALQGAILHEQNIRQIEQQGKLNALSATLEGVEKERGRIANDLHDGLGGLLTAVKAHAGSLHPIPDQQPLLDTTNRLIDDACVEVRRIAHNMMPRALTLSGLTGAVDDIAQDLRRQGIDCDLETKDLDQPIDASTAVLVYRIIQELTTNIVRHANATHILLQVIRDNGTLTIIMEDNGRGFDVATARQAAGLGLSSIESRVRLLNGTIDWDSVIGQGTTVSIAVTV